MRRLDLDARLGIAVPDALALAALGYLLLPALMFLGAWLRWPLGAAAVGAGLAGFALTPGWRGGWPLGRRATLACVAGGAAWALLASGTHHLLYAAVDWQIRDALLHDLARGPWPVSYMVGDLSWLLRAPLGYYLPAAATGPALAQAAADTPLLVLPAFPVGRSGEHTAFPGTLTLGAETLSRVWFEIGQSVHRAGLRKLVIVNSHGGQPQICDIVALDLRMRLGMLAVVANTFAFGEPAGLFPEEERRHGIHAGAHETSILLHLQPATVRTARIDVFQPASAAHDQHHRELRFHGKVAMGWATQDLHPQGACGDARLASAAAGQAIVEHVAARLAVLLDEVSRYPLANLKTGPLDARRAP